MDHKIQGACKGSTFTQSADDKQVNKSKAMISDDKTVQQKLSFAPDTSNIQLSIIVFCGVFTFNYISYERRGNV